MSRKKLVIAYHTDNQDVAKQIEQQFATSGYTFKHITNTNNSIGNQLTDAALPTILLVSDNFLKSDSSMENAMDWTQKMLKLDLLLPVVIDGKEKNEQTGRIETQPTIFQRVSDVIKYMNYWQDQYLLLRKKRRTAPIKEEPALSAKLAVVKGVSSEIGEYLRYLKGKNPISFEDFSKNGFAAFYNFTKDQAGHTAFKTKNNITEVKETPKVEKVEKVETPATPIATPPPKQEFKTINDRFKTNNPETIEDEIPTFVPATVPTSKPKVAKQTEAKITENIEEEIPAFVPATVPERTKNGVKKEAEKVESTIEDIPDFVPATVPERAKNGHKEEEKTAVNTVEEDDEIPVFVPAVVPERSRKKVESTQQPVAQKEEEKEDDIPVFVPATVPERAKNKEKNIEPEQQIEDEIPVFVPAVVPERSKKKEEIVKDKQERKNQSLVDIIQASSKQILEENEQEELEKSPETEDTPPVDLDTLPGMELLNASEPKTEIKPSNLEDDFIAAIEAFDDIDESDMELEEEEEVGNLEDLANQIDEQDDRVSMDELNQIVEDIVEEEAQDTNDLAQNEEEELADIVNILEDNKVQEEAAIDAVFNQNKLAEETNLVEKAANEDISDLFEAKEDQELSTEKLEVDTDDLKDEELVRLISEVEARSETEISEEESSDNNDEVEENQVEASNDFSDIFEEEEEEEEEDEDEDEDEVYMETDSQISRAYQYFEAEDWDGGLAVLKDGLTQKPENSDLRFQYALALAKHKNNFDDATKQLEILLGFDQQHEEAFFLLGELSELHKDFLMARNYYDKVAAINPNFPEIYYRLGIITNLHFDDEKEAAADYFKKATKKNKLNADAHYRLGILMNEHFENHLKAVKYFKKVLNVQPEHPFANYDLAILYHRLNDRALANIYYQKAVDINPELKTPANDAAFRYELIGNVEEVLSTENIDDSKEAELSRDMARLEAKMTGLAAEQDAVRQQVLGDLEGEFGEERDEEMENLFADEVRDAPATDVPLMPKQVDKTILITGATSGIGRATAEVFAENGYRIIITGRREERLEALKEDFEIRFGSEILTLPFDVRNVDEVQSAIDSLESEWRDIDILLNNAGLAKGKGPIHEGDLHHWEQMIDTNIKGLLYMTRAIVPHMVANREGHIINIASSAGKEVYPGGNVYCATKHAVDALTRAMRIDLHSHNVRVSQVAPGMVEETEFSLVRHDGDAEKAKIYEDFNPLTARDVAEVIYFVATRPKHVNVQDVLMFGTQQANSIYTHRNGRESNEQ